MAIVLGPVLAFRGTQEDRWNVSVLFVFDGPAQRTLRWGDGPAGNDHTGQGQEIASHDGRRVWRYDLAVPNDASARTINYTLDDEAVAGLGWSFSVPGQDQMPRVAYASCNGFSDPRDMKKVDDKNAQWKNMAQRHAGAAFHLLLMGGDQVYGDQIWELPQIKQWLEQDRSTRRGAAFTAAMKGAVEKFYFDLYCARWSQAEPAALLASVPTLMMWDDHDIFDGWGSYPKDDHECAVYRGIFRAARNAFQIFQRHSKPGDLDQADITDRSAGSAFDLPPYLGSVYRMGGVGIVVLDMRSQRTQTRVIGDAAWNDVFAWVDRQKDLKHLLVMSSIPVVHPDFGLLESLLGVLPGQQELEDDLRDHWRSRPHKEERLRLIHRLLAFSQKQKTRVTLLSGDVHVGAVGVVESQRSGGPENASVINQLTASAIVHPAPDGMVLYFLEMQSGRVEDVDRGITARMLKFPGTTNAFIGARNWLALEPDPEQRLWANWHVEGEATPYTKVIHPVQGIEGD